jgi:hypothetical protein
VTGLTKKRRIEILLETTDFPPQRIAVLADASLSMVYSVRRALRGYRPRLESRIVHLEQYVRDLSAQLSYVNGRLDDVINQGPENRTRGKNARTVTLPA